MTTRRTPTGAAVLQPEVTNAITEAVLDELAEVGFGRLSMEAVAKRAGVGKSALYRRWPSKDEMIGAVVAEFSVARAVDPDTGSLRGDLRATLDALYEWITHPRFSRILPGLIAEASRNPEMAAFSREAIGGPRRAISRAVFTRAIERGEIPANTDVELAQDIGAGIIYWRLIVRGVPAGEGYLDQVTDLVVRALSA
ncbi:TetR/AcrR family transcriptional regulator [Amycolatopsis echigonensis]|uniref:TetR/AcrR family transcriptional regulator n=1 Tax=Amycolatopsis echigonensis TaxID=2576905 RepID=A0A8E2B584_9PSEU|nr:TetR/AcrR family transcriptional regulator [Amycolatopsis echigonensis]MBB2501901.1 TetR/AcrR family transcriptional regulator [Amycolatopsis echigonensis]